MANWAAEWTSISLFSWADKWLHSPPVVRTHTHPLTGLQGKPCISCILRFPHFLWTAPLSLIITETCGALWLIACQKYNQLELIKMDISILKAVGNHFLWGDFSCTSWFSLLAFSELAPTSPSFRMTVGPTLLIDKLLFFSEFKLVMFQKG